MLIRGIIYHAIRMVIIFFITKKVLILLRIRTFY
nr:MAG TPA: hypothetical protein [Caudoviricetes sp.]